MKNANLTGRLATINSLAVSRVLPPFVISKAVRPDFISLRSAMKNRQALQVTGRDVVEIEEISASALQKVALLMADEFAVSVAPHTTGAVPSYHIQVKCEELTCWVSKGMPTSPHLTSIVNPNGDKILLYVSQSTITLGLDIALDFGKLIDIRLHGKAIRRFLGQKFKAIPTNTDRSIANDSAQNNPDAPSSDSINITNSCFTSKEFPSLPIKVDVEIQESGIAASFNFAFEYQEQHSLKEYTIMMSSLLGKIAEDLAMFARQLDQNRVLSRATTSTTSRQDNVIYATFRTTERARSRQRSEKLTMISGGIAQSSSVSKESSCQVIAAGIAKRDEPLSAAENEIIDVPGTAC